MSDASSPTLPPADPDSDSDRDDAVTDTPDGKPVEHMMNRVRTVARAETVTTRDLVEAGGKSSFVPAMMIPALLVVSPLSGIPGFSSLMGLTIAIIAAQLVFGRDHLWLPDMLMRRQMRGARVEPALGRLTGFARWIDRHSHERLRALTTPPLVKLAQALCMVCGLGMPFLELVPFSSSILGTAVIFFSVGFLARDGLYVIAAFAMMGIATVVPVAMILWVSG